MCRLAIAAACIVPTLRCSRHNRTAAGATAAALSTRSVHALMVSCALPRTSLYASCAYAGGVRGSLDRLSRRRPSTVRPHTVT